MRPLALVPLLWLLAATASAQGIEWRAAEEPTEEDIAAGRDAYGRGLAALEAGDAAEALALFRASYARSGAAAALFNGAVALTRLERWAEARAALDALAAIEAPDAVRAPARELATEVDAHLASLRVVRIPVDARVVLDGRPIERPPGATEHEERLDPGTHALSVRAPSRPPFHWNAELLPGERRVVTVELPGLEAPAPPGDDPTLGIVLGVVAAVLVIGGAIALGVALDDAAQLSPDAPHVVRLP